MRRRKKDLWSDLVHVNVLYLICFGDSIWPFTNANTTTVFFQEICFGMWTEQCCGLLMIFCVLWNLPDCNSTIHTFWPNEYIINVCALSTVYIFVWMCGEYQNSNMKLKKKSSKLKKFHLLNREMVKLESWFSLSHLKLSEIYIQFCTYYKLEVI